jgi:hypothetical protein
MHKRKASWQSRQRTNWHQLGCPGEALQENWPGHLCRIRHCAFQMRIMASPPAEQRWPLHMARVCTAPQCASAWLLHTSGRGCCATVKLGSPWPFGASPMAGSASSVGRKALMVASCNVQ